MIKGLGLLGIRKEAATAKIIDDLFGTINGPDIYQKLLAKTKARRRMRTKLRAKAAATNIGKKGFDYDLTQATPRHRELARRYHTDYLNNKEMAELSSMWPSHTPGGFADTMKYNFEPGRIRKNLDRLGETPWGFRNLSNSEIADKIFNFRNLIDRY